MSSDNPLNACALCPGAKLLEHKMMGDGKDEKYSCKQVENYMLYELKSEVELLKKRVVTALHVAKYLEQMLPSVAALADASTDCPQSFFAWKGDCYIVEVNRNHGMPNQYCKGKGAHLPTVHSQEEDDFIAMLYGAKGWGPERAKLATVVGHEAVEVEFGGALGLRRKSSTKGDTSVGWNPHDWAWADGSEITYTNWVGTEPNNWGREGPGTGWEEFAYVQEYGWIDTPSYPGPIYVCEIDKSVTLSTSTTSSTLEPQAASSACQYFAFVLPALAALVSGLM